MNPPDPGLKPPDRRLRLLYDSKRPSKSTVNVPPGDELEVSETVAAQLQGDDSHFRPLGEPFDAEDADATVDDADDGLCGGTTAKGDPCSKAAGDDGFCHLHGA